MSVFNSICREVEIAKFEVKDHFSLYKKWYILFGIIVIISFIVGVIVGCSMKTNMVLTKIPEKLFVKFVQGEMSVGNLIFARLGSVIGFAFILWLSCFKPYLSILGVALLAYRSFILGLTSVMLILLYSVSGLLNVLLVMIPCYLTTLLLLVVFWVICVSFCVSSKKYGGSVVSVEFWCTRKKALIVVGVGLFVCALLEVLLLPLISGTLIVVK